LIGAELSDGVINDVFRETLLLLLLLLMMMMMMLAYYH